jgi:hypothetical protein
MELTNIESVKGVQPSKWDKYYPEFRKAGDTLQDDVTVMNRAAASQFAVRMNKLEQSKGGKRIFHSGYNTLNGKTFVRVRPEGEVPEKEEEQSEE